MRIYVVVEKTGSWYPQNSIALLKKTGRFEFVENPKDADIIWIFSYYQPLEDIVENNLWLRLFVILEKLQIPIIPKLNFRAELKGKLVVTSFHHLFKTKESEFRHRVVRLNEFSDVIQIFSKRNVKDLAGYFSKPILFAPYWIDLEKFRPLPAAEKMEVRKRYALPLDKKIIGSFQRDTDRDGHSPKLEKGPDIFCDAIEPLAHDNIFVLLAGPRRNYVENRLRDKGVPFKSIGFVSYDEINALYHCLDYYLVTSRCEGGPQAILECMASRIPILSTSVGIADLLDPRVVLNTAQEFTHMIESRSYPDVLEQHYKTVQSFDANSVAKDYDQKFERLLQEFSHSNRAGIEQICADSRQEGSIPRSMNKGQSESLFNKLNSCGGGKG